MAVESCVNGWFHALSNCGGSTQVTTTFLAQTLGQVAGTALTVHRLAFGRQTEPFLGPFVSFDFGSHEGINTGWMVNYEKRSVGAYRKVLRPARASVRILPRNHRAKRRTQRGCSGKDRQDGPNRCTKVVPDGSNTCMIPRRTRPPRNKTRETLSFLAMPDFGSPANR